MAAFFYIYLMDQQRFERYSLNKKITTLYEHGTFVVAIRYYKYKVNLYILGNFYVEVFFNHKMDAIEKVVIMEKNTTRLKFYSDQVKLPLDLVA